MKSDKNTRIKEVLKEMNGKSYQVYDSIHTIVNYSVFPDGRVKILTNKGDFNYFSAEEALEAIQQEFKESSGEIDIPKTQVSSLILELKNMGEFGNHVKKLNDMMFEAAKKVNENADFVPQAQIINVSVKNMIELAKLQLEAVRLIVNQKKGGGNAGAV